MSAWVLSYDAVRTVVVQARGAQGSERGGATQTPYEVFLASGAMVAHYRVQRLLGRGSMGEVYLARDTLLGRKVALKLVRSDALGDTQALERFLHEARVTARFNHPHIVTIYGVGEQDGWPYVALEYLEGETLRDRMEAEQLSVKESLRIALAIAEALQEAHSHQVLHRDLKPRNVFLARDGRLRVLDFGLAKLLGVPSPVAVPTGSTKSDRPAAAEPGAEAALDATLPATRAAIASVPPPPRPPTSVLQEVAERDGFESLNVRLRGTPAYMAPEQWLLQTVSPQTDMWALGVMLYELLTGDYPYDANSMQDLAVQVTSAAVVPSLRRAGPDVPVGVVRFVDGCLDKEAEERPTAEAAVQILQELLGASSDRPAEDRTPFRGLMPFSERHADLYFGRETEVASFLERMREEPVLPVVGPSGTGKSSFVQAGVIPRLREQGRWIVIRLRPGSTPFETLAGRLASSEPSSRSLVPVDSLGGARISQLPSSPQQRAEERELAQSLREAPTRLALLLGQLAEAEQCRVLLFVDQLEELYTLVDDEQERHSFMRALCTSADEAAGPVRTVFTLRDDFLWRLAEGREARHVLSRVSVLRPPGAEALVQTLERPVQKLGYRYEDPELPQQMVAEVQGEASALPLLQFVARQLWEHRDQELQQLTVAAYERVGGVTGALAQHADSSLESLSAAQVRVARELLLRLVTPENTRRVMPRSELLDGLGDDAPEVLELFTAARTVVVRKGSADAELELVHESLIAGWKRLSQWLEESRERREFLAQLEQAASLWEARGRPADEVWQGDALTDALRKAVECQALPGSVERFLDAGKQRSQRSVRRRQGVLAGAVGLLAIVAVAAVVVGWALRAKEREAQRQRRIAEDRGTVADRRRGEAVHQRAAALREGARAAYVRGAFVESRAKLRQSLETEDSPLARALWSKLDAAELRWQRDLGATVYAAAFSPDGRQVAVCSMDQTVHIIDVDTLAERVLRGHDDQVLAVAFAPAGPYLAAATLAGTLQLWNLDTGEASKLEGHAGGVRHLAFSPDGRLVATAGGDQTVRLWDVWPARAAGVLKGHEGQVNAVSFSPDGRQLASAGYDRTVRLWDVRDRASRAVLRGHDGPVHHVAFSPDGTQLASTSTDQTIVLWDAATGEKRTTFEGHRGVVYRASFDRNGRWLASSGADETIRLWDLGRARLHAVLTGHRGGVRDVAFSPDGTLLASASVDQTVRLWDARNARPRAVPQGHEAQVSAAAFSPDGTLLASGGVDKTVRLWDTASARTVAVLAGHEATIWSVGFSPDGEQLASASSDQTVRLWNVATRQPSTILEGHGSDVWGVDFDPAGQRLASCSSDKTIRLWDPHTGQLHAVLQGHKGTVWSVDFSPDGRRLASASDDQSVRLWDVQTAQASAVLPAHDAAVYDARFDPTGRLLASASEDKTVKLWNQLAPGDTKAQQVLGPHSGRAYSVDIDRSGQHLGVACSDGTAHIWDLETSQAVVLRGHVAEVNNFRFSADGKRAVTSCDDGTVRLWETDTGRPVWRAPLLRRQGPELLSHRGWLHLGYPPRVRPPPATKWRETVEQRAQLAAESADGSLLCLGSYDGTFEMWDPQADRRLHREPLAELAATLAVGDGCLTLAAGTVRFHPKQGASRELHREVTAMAWQGEELLLAVGREVMVEGLDGVTKATHQADVGITALTRVGEWIAVGFKDGAIELVGQRPGSSGPGVTFEDTPASPVVRLLPGPKGTLIAGYANGVFGLWSLSNGIRLEHRRIHGPVVHLLVERGKLYAASELGQLEILPLEGFHVPYCALLQKVWERVPVVWLDGLAVRRPAPKDHRCADASRDPAPPGSSSAPAVGGAAP